MYLKKRTVEVYRPILTNQTAKTSPSTFPFLLPHNVKEQTRLSPRLRRRNLHNLILQTTDHPPGSHRQTTLPSKETVNRSSAAALAVNEAGFIRSVSARQDPFSTFGTAEIRRSRSLIA
jgi:hypothetical protein